MCNNRHAILKALGTAAVIGLSVGNVYAASGDEAFCNRYTKNAIQQQQTNLARGCGFSGDAWSSNRDWHFNWCMRVQREPAQTGNIYRINKLKSECKTAANTAKNGQSFCSQYAHNAILANKLNRAQGCGFGGPVWSSNYNHHYKWCLTANRSDADNGERLRNNKLANSCSPG